MSCENCKGAGEFDFATLHLLLSKYIGTKGALIPVLQKAQNIYGYLPRPVLEEIANHLDIPVGEIFGVVTFYSQFHLKPRGKNIIRVCQGTACHVRGAKTILDTIATTLHIKPGETTDDLKFTLETVACIGACGLAPVIMINDQTHGRLTPKEIPAILDSYSA